MTDVFSPQERSRVMAKVKAQNTKPEVFVRSLIHRMGFRFRLHNHKLPGKPDVVLPKYKKIIFIHGCFWHQHPACPQAARPTSNVEYWNKKLDNNVNRDRKNVMELERLGWQVLVIWECEIKEYELLLTKLANFLHH